MEYWYAVKILRHPCFGSMHRVKAFKTKQDCYIYARNTRSKMCGYQEAVDICGQLSVELSVLNQ